MKKCNTFTDMGSDRRKRVEIVEHTERVNIPVFINTFPGVTKKRKTQKMAKTLQKCLPVNFVI